MRLSLILFILGDMFQVYFTTMLNKIRYRLVYNRKHHLNRYGAALVQVEALQGRKKAYFTTKVYVSPDQWQDGHVVHHPNETGLNAILVADITSLEAIEIELWKRGIEPSIERLKEAVRYGVTPQVELAKFARGAIDNMQGKSEGTLCNYRSTVAWIERYMKGRPLYINTVNPKWMRGFEEYLASQMAFNTVQKVLRQMRALYNEAIRQKLVKPEQSPFGEFKMKSMTHRNVYLTPMELQRMENYAKEKRPLHWRVLELFLFACYTGLRLSDLRTLDDEHILEIDGVTWIVKVMFKTKTEVRIPVSELFDGKAMQLLDRMGGVKRLCRIGHDSTLNRKVREIAAHLKIDKHLTMHTARHTCATVLLYQGIPMTTVQKILGHTSIETTQIYADVMNETMLKDVSRVKQQPQQLRLFPNRRKRKEE